MTKKGVLSMDLLRSRFRGGLSLAALLAGGLCAWTGCEPTRVDDAGNRQTSSKADLPSSYPAAVARLKFLADEILDATSEGTPGEAHGALHEISNLIPATPKLADAAKMPSDDFSAVQQASNELFGAFEKIDGSLHGRLAEGETLDVDALRTQVESAMAVLDSKVALVSDQPVDVQLEADDPHDHDHGEASDHHGDEHDGEHHDDDHDHEGDVDHDPNHAEGDHDHGDDVGDDAPGS